MLLYRSRSHIQQNPNIYFPEVEKKSDPSWFSIPIILKKNSKFKRDDLISYLEKQGIESRPIIVGNLQKHPVAKLFKELRIKKFKNADYIHNNGIYIGLNPMIEKDSFNKMIKVFENFFKN